MEEFGERIGEHAVRFERLLPGPIERVWRYLVEEDKRARWLCGGRTELKVGGAVELHFHNASLSDAPDVAPAEKYRDLPEKTQFAGTVTRCEPPRLLAHTWDFEGQSSEVLYELSEQGDRVLLVLTHTRLASDNEVLSVCGGWHTHLAILDDVLTGAEVRPFWATHNAIEAEYERRLSP